MNWVLPERWPSLGCDECRGQPRGIHARRGRRRHAHIEQVSVDPSHARQGLGRSLLDTASAWAEERGLAALTLTTYAEVPWNAPYYRRLGFQELAVDQMSSGLRHIRDQESARGLDEWPRVAMRRQLDPPSLSS
jgi:GNAT superfamily N-acetyltransferase